MSSSVRIYGIVEPSKEALKQTLHRMEEAKKRDHRKLGKDLQLFHIDEEVGQGADEPYQHRTRGPNAAAGGAQWRDAV